MEEISFESTFVQLTRQKTTIIFFKLTTVLKSKPRQLFRLAYHADKRKQPFQIV